MSFASRRDPQPDVYQVGYEPCCPEDYRGTDPLVWGAIARVLRRLAQIPHGMRA
ncbi:MAG: hypothetical protein Q4G41_01490 [Coriobacteriales bacterium]|nr:hypothetical protein [Coriobacteriales bacterium]